MNTKHLLALVCLFIVNGLSSQTAQLYGTAAYGGANGSGTIVKMNPDGTGFTKVYDFVDATGSTPVGTLVVWQDGKLYGNCETGGGDGSCVLYSYDPATGVYKMEFDYGVNTGDVPTSGLIVGNDGTLWGTCSSGGQNNAGVIFNFMPSTGTYTDVYDFPMVDSASFIGGPMGPPVTGRDGKLYGMMSGDIYSFGDYSGWGYATTSIYYGNIYSYDITHGTYTNLHTFAGVNDGLPYGGLLQLNDGKFYGLSSGTGGYLYAYMSQYGPDTLQQLGIYSTYIPNNYGNLFMFDPVSNTYTNLYNFDSVQGAYPMSSLMQAADGKLYGTTIAGGIYNSGTIFSYDLQSHTFLNLFNFDNNTSGAYPSGDLSQSSDGNLYGSTLQGGNGAAGVFFSFNPVTQEYKVIDALDSYSSGSTPMGGTFAKYDYAVATSIVTPDTKPVVSVYPVPATNYVMLHVETTTDTKTTATLVDENGKTAWTGTVTDATTYVNLQGLAKGIYMMQVTANGQQTTKQVVVQ